MGEKNTSLGLIIIFILFLKPLTSAYPTWVGLGRQLTL